MHLMRRVGYGRAHYFQLGKMEWLQERDVHLTDTLINEMLIAKKRWATIHKCSEELRNKRKRMRKTGRVEIHEVSKNLLAGYLAL